MKKLRFIIVTIITLVVVSCADFRLSPEVSVPEINSLFSDPETNSVTLTSSLSKSPVGRIQCGFYIGKNKKTLTQYIGQLEKNNFHATILNLDDGTTYWFKAFVTNGINEICTNLQSFETFKKPVIDTPDPLPPDPDSGHNPEPEPDPSPEEKPNPQEPVIPVPEFTTELGSIYANINGEIIEFIANITGDSSLIKEMWFQIGTNPDNLTTKVSASLEGNSIKGYTTTSEYGIYWFKAYITDGKTTKESGICSFEIKAPIEPPVSKPEPEPEPEQPGPDKPILPEPEPEPEPEPKPDVPITPPVEFTTEIGEISIKNSGDMVIITAEIIGNANLIKEGFFSIGKSDNNMNNFKGSIDANKMSLYLMGLPSGNYRIKACISDGTKTKETEIKTFTIQ